MKIAIQAWGKTYPVKEELKKLGFKWNVNGIKEWVWFGESVEAFEIADRLVELGLEPWLLIGTDSPKMRLEREYKKDGVYYCPARKFEDRTEEKEFGRKFFTKYNKE
ncbi:MAG: hypothetical protein J7K87_03910 [Candidatus Aenigmarchaeota archaeon]|nr:hypothetical protein [Candidatus Aenigmarchaeota archaeon]